MHTLSNPRKCKSLYGNATKQHRIIKKLTKVSGDFECESWPSYTSATFLSFSPKRSTITNLSSSRSSLVFNLELFNQECAFEKDNELLKIDKFLTFSSTSIMEGRS